MTMLADIDVEQRINARRVAPLADLVPQSQAWRDARGLGIGGSEAAAVAGVGEFDSAFEVYLRKTGTHPDGRDWEGNDAANWGTMLEPIVRDHCARTTGLTIVRPTFMYQHESIDWMLVNPDGFVIDPVWGLGLYEGKTASHWMGERWGLPPEEPATYALMQCVHGMEVLDLDFAVIAVLIAGQDFRHYRIRRDPELAGMVIELEADFWDRCQRKDPPLATWRDSDTDLLSRLWDGTETSPLVVDEDAVELARVYKRAHRDMSAAEKIKKEAGNRLRQIMGDHTEAIDAQGRTVCTWKPSKSRRLNQARFEATSPHLHATYCDDETSRTLLPKELP